MAINVHNPDQYMAGLRQIIAQGRKRLGILVGAGAPAGIPAPDGSGPLIPAVAGLTDRVIAALVGPYGTALDAIKGEIENPNIENILSRVRSLAGVIGKTKVHGLDCDGHNELGKAICTEIGKIVNQPLPEGPSAYTEFVNWISGTARAGADLGCCARRSRCLGSSLVCGIQRVRDLGNAVSGSDHGYGRTCSGRNGRRDLEWGIAACRSNPAGRGLSEFRSGMPSL